MDKIWRADALTWVLDTETAQGIAAHEIAGLGSRFVASAIDWVIKLVPLCIALWVLSVYRPALVAARNLGWLVVVFVLLDVLYSLFFEFVANGQTPGKNACALRVVSQTGVRASFSQLLVRSVMRVADAVGFFSLVGVVAALLSPSAQRLGDRLARTVVIHEESLRELLERAEVPASVYSPSEDGYLLEAFLMRSAQLREEVQVPLARQLAQYFYRNYPPEDRKLLEAFGRMQYLVFLQELYRLEKEVQP